MANESPSKIIHIDEQLVQSQLKDVVKNTVEETLNELLNEEADRLCNAKRYERNKERKDTQAGHYTRNIDTSAGRDYGRSTDSCLIAESDGKII
jgi:transposase-like protein